MAEQNTLEGFNARSARVGMTGAVRHAPLGTPPVPMGTKYDTNIHKNYGYLAPDGLEISFDEDKNEYIPWQEVTAIRTDITKAVKGVKFILWETSLDNIAKFLGVKVEDIVEKDGVYSFYEGALPHFEDEWLSLDVVDGDKAMRLTLLSAKITERGSMIFKKDEMFGLKMTYNSAPAGDDYAQTTPEAVGKTAHWQFNSDWAEGKKSATSSTTDGVTPLSFVTAADLGSTSQDAVAETINVRGGTAPYTFAVESGDLPNGVELDAKAGEITGAASETGTFTFTIKVTDSKNLSATREFTLEVTGA